MELISLQGKTNFREARRRVSEGRSDGLRRAGGVKGLRSRCRLLSSLWLRSKARQRVHVERVAPKRFTDRLVFRAQGLGKTALCVLGMTTQKGLVREESWFVTVRVA